jgi:succinate-semialdehyde dehydrogenase / glutarate-semialdehyde dehydrogenase
MDQILNHEIIGGVSFTGSSRAGSLIASKAGQYLKKSVMELGGNDPFIVLIDADLKQAVADAMRGRSANCGQVCFSPKRFIIVRELYKAFK